MLFGALLVTSGCDNVLPKSLEDNVRRHLRDSRERKRMLSEKAVFKTEKGSFTVRFFGPDAPKSVLFIRKLISDEFYDGLRVHRAVQSPIPFLIQVGDPITRGVPGKDFVWQADRSEKPVAGFGSGATFLEFEKPKRKHTRGAVALAHRSNDKRNAGQFYITLAPQPQLDGQYTVIGEVFEGMDVVEKLQRGDRIDSVRLVAP